MGKGKAQKRRAKNAFRANFSNLHKAQKGRASATTILPQPPKKSDFEDSIPKGLKKLQALKEAAQEADRAKRRRLNQQVASAPTQLQDDTTAAPATPAAEAFADGRAPPAADDAASHQGPSQAPADAAAPKPAKRKHVGLEAPIPYEEQQHDKSEKKKLYRKQLRERHKAKRKGKDRLEPTATTAQVPPAAKAVPFGEQADAPPDISLKRKHWSEQDAAKRNNERCKQIFLKQLETAQKKASLMTGLPDSGLALKKKALQDKEKEAVRAHVIEAYRAKKTKQGDTGAATRSSLAALVMKGQQALSGS